MDEKELYSRILNRLYEGLKTENHSKFKNDRLAERKFAVNDLYPDIILTKKDSDEIEFIIEIVVKSHLNKDALQKKWKPLSESGPIFYLLVPKANRNIVENWCNEEKIKFRIGTYELISNNLDIKFF
jgi:hypothetical protein